MPADTHPAPPRPALGTTAIFEATFRTYLHHAVPLFLIAYLPTVLITIVTDRMTVAMMERAFAGAVDPSRDFFTLFSGGFIAVILASMVIGGVIMAILTLSSADLIRGAGLRLGANLGITLARIVPLTLLLIVATVGFLLGWMLFFIPGLLLMAMWSVMLPALLMENHGFGALGRSRALTKDYRWPIIGGFGLLILVLIAISVPVSFLPAGIDFETPGLVSDIPLWASALSAIPGALFYGLWAVFTVLLYTRLVEIKEGGPEGLAHVFE